MGNKRGGGILVSVDRATPYKLKSLLIRSIEADISKSISGSTISAVEKTPDSTALLDMTVVDTISL